MPLRNVKLRRKSSRTFSARVLMAKPRISVESLILNGKMQRPMKKYLVFAALAFAALVSCNKEISNEQMPQPSAVKEGYVEITLSAGMDASTKAVLAGNTVLWAVGDKVAVYPDAATAKEEFTVKTVEGKNVTITGSVPAGTTSLVAVYPYASALGRDGNTVTVDIPPTQDIPDGGTIDPAAMCSAAVYTDLTQTAQFQNLFSLLAFNVGDVTDANIVGLYATGLGVSLTGSFNASLTSDGPVLTPVTGSVDGSSVKVFAEKGKFFAKKTQYYAVVAPCVVEGFTAGVGNDSKLGTVTSAKTLTLERNKGVNLGDVSSKVTFKYRAIHNAEELQDFLATASVYTADDEVVLANDIDMSGVTLAPDTEGGYAAASSFKGVFDGKGYSIKNWASEGVALFKSVSGAVKNVTLDASCTLTNPPAVGSGFSFLVCALPDGAKVSGCVNKANVAITAVNNGGTQYRYGSIVGVSQKTALVENCDNYGSIDFGITTGSSKIKTHYLGGIIACTNGPTDQLRISKCHNYGDHITVTVLNGAGGNVFNNIYVGGISASTGVNEGTEEKASGYTSNYGVYSECTNNADITASWQGGTGGYFKVGGIVGYAECKLKDCTNNGNVLCSIPAEVGTNSSSPGIGGIAGVLAGTAPVNADGCVNKGSVVVSGVFTNASTHYGLGVGGNNSGCIGGCFGLVGDNTTLISDCHNQGTLTVNTSTTATAGSWHIAGGVAGYCMATMTNCSNDADFDVTIKARIAHVGGIAGYCTKPISNSTNSGILKVSHNGDNLTKDQSKITINLGGIVGYSGTTTGDLDSCTNGGAVKLLDTNGDVRLGGIGGMVYGTVNKCNNVADVTLERVVFSTFSFASHVGGVVGYFNLESKPFTNCSNTAKVSATLDEKANTSNVGGVLGYMQIKSSMSNCSNTGDVSLDGGGTVNVVRAAGVVARTNKADSDLTGLTNSGNIRVFNFAGATKNSYAGGVLGQHQDGGNDMTDCENTGNLTFNGTGMMRAGGLVGSLFGTFTNCSTQGDVVYENVGAGSFVGGLAGYGSASVTGGSVNTTITVSNSTGNCNAGCLYGVGYREYTIQGLTLNGSITGSDLTAGVLLGNLNNLTSETDESKKLATIYTLGTTESPLTIKSSVNINGTPVAATPSTDADLIGDPVTLLVAAQAGRPVLNYVNVVVE